MFSSQVDSICVHCFVDDDVSRRLTFRWQSDVGVARCQSRFIHPYELSRRRMNERIMFVDVHKWRKISRLQNDTIRTMEKICLFRIEHRIIIFITFGVCIIRRVHDVHWSVCHRHQISLWPNESIVEDDDRFSVDRWAHQRIYHSTANCITWRP